MADTTCGGILASVGFDCLNPLSAGTRDRGYILNHEDYLDAVKAFNATNDMILEGLTLAGAASAFYVDGKNNSNAPSFALVKQTYADVFDHTFNFLAFDLSNAAKKTLQGMVGGRYVVIYENSFKGASGQSAFEVLGAVNGLEFKTFTRDPLSADNQGAYVISMASPDLGKEPKIPYSFFLTDYVTTKAALEALL